MVNYLCFPKRDPTVKRFIVKGSEAHNHTEALNRFRRWHDKYYPDDSIEVYRISSEKCYIIEYQVLQTRRQRQLITKKYTPHPNRPKRYNKHRPHKKIKCRKCGIPENVSRIDADGVCVTCRNMEHGTVFILDMTSWKWTEKKRHKGVITAKS